MKEALVYLGPLNMETSSLLIIIIYIYYEMWKNEYWKDEVVYGKIRKDIIKNDCICEYWRVVLLIGGKLRYLFEMVGTY